MHECKRTFKTEKIDECSGEGYNRCFGDSELTLKLWYAAKDGTDCYYDDWIQEKVDFCPYCGYQPKRINREDVKYKNYYDYELGLTERFNEIEKDFIKKQCGALNMDMLNNPSEHS